MAVARATGETLEERLITVLRVLAEHYGKPPQLAQIRIVLDLTQNPNTSDETRQIVLARGRELSKAWQPLFDRSPG